MAVTIMRAQYFYSKVQDQPGQAYRLLAGLASAGVNLLSFAAIPVGEQATQLTMFPHNVDEFLSAAAQHGIVIEGPQRALVIRGDHQLQELAEIHRKLYDAGINVYTSTGVAADCGRFGYVIYVKGNDFERAARVLEV